jgi:TRAP transporter TAXI family solute receptor
MTAIPTPHADRSIRLHFQGDWGNANLHRVLGWLCAETVNLYGPRTRVAIWNGTGALDNVRAVGRGDVDVALVTPATFVAMALEGRGPCASEAFPHLRALGYVPQNDRLIFAVRRELGVKSFDDLRRIKSPLRIAAGLDDGVNFMGMAAQHLMAKSGISRGELESWGGCYIEHGLPFPCIEEMLAHRADAIIQEAVLTRAWHQMAETIDLAFIPIEPGARDALQADLAWPSAKLPKGYMRGMDEEMEFLDFSHFLALTTTDLPDDIAYALAWSLVEKRKNLEDQYRHIPAERSPVSYPINPQAICRTSIPLHPGAERYFRSAGHL